VIKDLRLPHYVERLKELTLFNSPRRRLKGFLVMVYSYYVGVPKSDIQSCKGTAWQECDTQQIQMSNISIVPEK